MSSNKKKVNNISIKNKKAKFEYEWLDTYIAGLVLKGTEIKALRLGRASINDAYCFVNKGEVFVKNMHIGAYEWSSAFDKHEERAMRKLLLHKKEINKIFGQVKNAGITCIPLKLFINDKGLAKIEVGVVKGKKLYDKRESIKTREADIALSRVMKKKADF